MRKTDQLKAVAKILTNRIRNELTEDLLKELGAAPKGSRIEDFKWMRKSLTYRIVGGKIIIQSTWKLMRKYLDGEDIVNLPVEQMVEVDEEAVEEIEIDVDKVTREEEKDLPAPTNMWVHPKAYKRDFIERAIRKSKAEITSAYTKGLWLHDVL